MKIGFFGTPELSARVLQDCISAGFEIVFVVSQPDKAVGRSSALIPSPVSKVAIAHNIPLLRPERIRGNAEFLLAISSEPVDYFAVVAYGKILPDDILAIPQALPINIHGSLLPKYRGASPIQSALLAGELITGVTIMQMTSGMDEGAILRTQEIVIDSWETSETLFRKFAEVSGPVLIDTIKSHAAGLIIPQEQDHYQASYTSKFTKSDGEIFPLIETALQIYRKYQAFTPWPGLWFILDGQRYKLGGISLSERTDLLPGYACQWAGGALELGCNSGVITIERITPEWKPEKQGADIFLAPAGVEIKPVFI
jgi:methionyl-tRNA formyltransferase